MASPCGRSAGREGLAGGRRGAMEVEARGVGDHHDVVDGGLVAGSGLVPGGGHVPSWETGVGDGGSNDAHASADWVERTVPASLRGLDCIWAQVYTMYRICQVLKTGTKKSGKSVSFPRLEGP